MRQIAIRSKDLPPDVINAYEKSNPLESWREIFWRKKFDVK